MMSRRFKLPHELSKIRNSTMDGIPEIISKEMDQDHFPSSQSNQKNDLESFLKERLEESNLIFENLENTSKSSHKYDNPEQTPNSFQQDPLTLSPEEETLLQEDYTLSDWINKEEEEKEREDYAKKSNLIIEEESVEITNINKEDSDSDFHSFPKKGDKVKVKYSEGWYIGRVHSISKKKTYFWVEFKGFDERFKVRKEE